jgi:hypothetical protein
LHDFAEGFGEPWTVLAESPAGIKAMRRVRGIKECAEIQSNSSVSGFRLVSEYLPGFGFV